jgi:linoleate 10R-lipoxygenase
MYPRDPVAREHAMREYSEFYFETTVRLLQEKSASVVGCQTRTVDVVRDVCNLVPVHWVSEHVVSLFNRQCSHIVLSLSVQAGIPLKTAKQPHGVHTEQEVYLYTMVVFT